MDFEEMIEYEMQGEETANAVERAMSDERSPKWRSVKNDPPTDGGWAWAGWQVVEIEGDPQVNLVDVSIDKSGYVWWYATEGQGYTELRKRPTHWMPLAEWPLPPAPEGDA